jgi:hypothetical protein
MKRILTIIFIILITNGSMVLAQDKGFTLLLGPSVNLFGGEPHQKFVYSSDRLSYQFNGILGFISTRGGTNRGNMLGIYASAGSTKPQMIGTMQLDSTELLTGIDMTKKFNEFYTLEAGMTILKFLRLSAGLGRQFYTYDTGKKSALNYYSGTIGLAFDLGAVNWVIDLNIMTGKDLSQNVLRGSTGFMVKF